jgi:hypothetical protein
MLCIHRSDHHPARLIGHTCRSHSGNYCPGAAIHKGPVDSGKGTAKIHLVGSPIGSERHQTAHTLRARVYERIGVWHFMFSLIAKYATVASFKRLVRGDQVLVDFLEAAIRDWRLRVVFTRSRSPSKPALSNRNIEIRAPAGARTFPRKRACPRVESTGWVAGAQEYFQDPLFVRGVGAGQEIPMRRQVNHRT